LNKGLGELQRQGLDGLKKRNISALQGIEPRFLGTGYKRMERRILELTYVSKGTARKDTVEAVRFVWTVIVR
jgi:hypothetical protein